MSTWPSGYDLDKITTYLAQPGVGVNDRPGIARDPNETVATIRF